MKDFFSTINNSKIYLSVIIVVIGIIVYQIIKATINKILEKDKEKNKLNKKGRTIVKLFTNIAKYITIAIVVILVLKIYGVNVNSLVAGIGLVSVVVGLAIQDPLKDIITGVNIITDDYYSIGDVVKIDDIEGKVIHLGVRTTKIKDIANGNVLVIANRKIDKVIKISDEVYMEIPLSYEDGTEKMVKIINKTLDIVKKHEIINDAIYLGIDKFADSSINYKLKIMCKPENKFAAKRLVNSTIKNELDKNGISIPYPQLTIHKEE